MFAERAEQGYGIDLEKNARVLGADMEKVRQVWEYYRRVQLIRMVLGEMHDKGLHQAISYSNDLHRGGVLGLLEKASNQTPLETEIRELGLCRYSS